MLYGKWKYDFEKDINLPVVKYELSNYIS